MPTDLQDNLLKIKQGYVLTQFSMNVESWREEYQGSASTSKEVNVLVLLEQNDGKPF